MYLPDANYNIFRNERGDVIDKNIHAIIKYQLNGKCYVQWDAFGYEALGGGVFSKDLTVYSVTGRVWATGAGDTVELNEGVAYEIDCNWYPFCKKKGNPF